MANELEDFFGAGKTPADTTTPPPPAGEENKNTPPPAGEENKNTPPPPAGEENKNTPPPPAGEENKNTPPPPAQDPWYKTHLGVDTEEEAAARIKSVKEFDPTPKYKSEKAKEIDTFFAVTGKDDPAALQFYKTEIKDGLSVDEKINLLVEKTILDNPRYASHKQALIGEWKEKLGLTLSEEDKKNLSASDMFAYDKQQIALDEEFDKVASDIKTTQLKLQNNGATPEEIANQKAEHEKNKGEWGVIVNEKLKNLKIDIPDWEENDKGEVKVLETNLKNFTFDEDSQKAFSHYYNSYVEAFGYPKADLGTKGGIAEQAENFAWAALIKDNFARMIKETVSETRSNLHKELLAKGVNPSYLKPEEKFTGKGGSGESKVKTFFGTAGQ